MLQTTIVTDLSVFDQDDDSDGGLFGKITKTESLYDTSTDDLFDFA